MSSNKSFLPNDHNATTNNNQRGISRSQGPLPLASAAADVEESNEPVEPNFKFMHMQMRPQQAELLVKPRHNAWKSLSARTASTHVHTGLLPPMEPSSIKLAQHRRAAANTATTATMSVPLSTVAKSKTTTTTNPVPLRWKNVQVKPVPQYYQLEANNLAFPRATLPAVLDRLRDLFRHLSLDTILSDAPVSATCLSLDRVRFVVTIWQDRNNNNKSSDDTCRVEVQRTGGCHMLYCQNGYARRVLAAVQGNAEAVASSMMVEDPLTIHPPSCQDQQRFLDSLKRFLCERPNESSGSPTSPLKFPLTDVQDKLCSVRCGEALRTLIRMTDPGQVGWTSAKTDAREVLLGSLSDTILELALNGQWPTVPSSSGPDTPRLEDDVVTGAHSLSALQILSQSINLLDDTEIVALESRCADRNLPLVVCLVATMGRADTNPGPASYATHILGVVCRVVPQTRALVPPPTLEFAGRVGLARHFGLAEAAHRLSRLLLLATNPNTTMSSSDVTMR